MLHLGIPQLARNMVGFPPEKKAIMLANNYSVGVKEDQVEVMEGKKGTKTLLFSVVIKPAGNSILVSYNPELLLLGQVSCPIGPVSGRNEVVKLALTTDAKTELPELTHIFQFSVLGRR